MGDGSYPCWDEMGMVHIPQQLETLIIKRLEVVINNLDARNPTSFLSCHHRDRHHRRYGHG
jgi:hypothetical protein